MIYSQLGKTGIDISRISLGAEHIENADFGTVLKIVDTAMDAGVNYTDLFMGSPGIRDNFGKALKGRRSRMMVAGHLGSVFTGGQYKRTRDQALAKEFFYDLLKRMDTDYIDMLMIHYVDEPGDWMVCRDGWVLDFACEMKKKGIARMVGISTHVPAVASEAVMSGCMDGIMFSLNPLFDLMPGDSTVDDLFKGNGLEGGDILQNRERRALYELCQSKGVGIVAMKVFAGGWLLKENPLLRMSTCQCISYALSRPGVATAACGCRSPEEFAESLAYLEAGENERDYAGIYRDSFEWRGAMECLYCNHCLPCPAGIDIAAAMKAMDCGGAAPEGCTGCGVCEQRCPFGVKVTARFLG
ncbi:MAG: aldo/keto reductase [Clostridia bacterium]|nr:aldo/keto reductase [Clostridia bacterium]